MELSPELKINTRQTYFAQNISSCLALIDAAFRITHQINGLFISQSWTYWALKYLGPIFDVYSDNPTKVCEVTMPRICISRNTGYFSVYRPIAHRPD